MNRILCLCVMLLLGAKWSYSQEPERKHIVKKGESIIQIASAYYVTPYDIFQLNPEASEGIKEGMELKIPKSKVQKKEVTAPQVPETKKITYKVKSGDTKYSLAKNFGISIEELESQNPQIVPTLMTGQTLRVETKQLEPTQPIKPESYVVKTGDTKFSLSQKFGVSIETLETMNPQIKKDLQVGQVISLDPENPSQTTSTPSAEGTKEIKEETPKYISYTIKPKETLYGLSKAANMTIPDFLKLNPSLSQGVKSGDIIKMPSHLNIDQKITSETDPKFINPHVKYTNLTSNLDVDQKKKVGFILPFTKNDFKSLSKSGASSISDSLTKQSVAFYEGVSIAIDSLETLGLSIDTEVIPSIKEFDIKTMNSFVKKSDLEDYQLLFMPFYESNTISVLGENLNNQTPIVTLTNDGIFTKGEIIQSLPSEEIQAKTILSYINSLNANVLVIHDTDRKEKKTLISSIISKPTFFEISGNGLIDNAKLVSSLKKDVKNIILFNTNQKKVYLNVTTPLLAESSKYYIQLAILDQKDLPSEVEVSKMRYKVLNLLYPSLQPSKANFADGVFQKKFKETFNREPSTISKYGFDITFDTVLRFYQNGSQPNMSDVSEHSALKFEYEKKSEGSYQNNGVYILKFDSNSERSEVR